MTGRLILRRRAVLLSAVLLLCLCHYSESTAPLRRLKGATSSTSSTTIRTKKTKDESKHPKQAGAKIAVEPASHKKLTRQEGFNAAKKTVSSDSREGGKIAAKASQQSSSSNKSSSTKGSSEAEKESTAKGGEDADADADADVVADADEPTFFDADAAVTRSPTPTASPAVQDDNKEAEKEEKAPFTAEEELTASVIDDEEPLDGSVQFASFSLIFDIQESPEPSDYADAIQVTKETLKPMMFYFYDDALEYFAMTTKTFGYTAQGPRIDFVVHVKFLEDVKVMSDEQVMEELARTFTEESFIGTYLTKLQALDSSNPFHATNTIQFYSDIYHDETFVEERAQISDYQNNSKYGGVVGGFAGAALLLALSGLIYKGASGSLWKAPNDGTTPKDVIIGRSGTTTTLTSENVNSLYAFLKKESPLNWLPQYWLEGREGDETDAEDDDEDDQEGQRIVSPCLNRQNYTSSNGTLQ